jgi:hypothetical protein
VRESIVSAPLGVTLIDPVPVFHTQQLNPDPSVAAEVNVTVKEFAVQLMIVPKSPATTV